MTQVHARSTFPQSFQGSLGVVRPLGASRLGAGLAHTPLKWLGEPICLHRWLFTRDGVTLPGTIFLIFYFDVLFSSASLFLVSLTAFRLWLHHASCRLTVCPLSTSRSRMLFFSRREGSSVKSCLQLRVLRLRSQWFLATSALQHGVSSKIMSPLELLAKRATPRERRRWRLSWRKRQLQAWRWPPTCGHRSPPSPPRRTPCTSSTATENWHLHLYLYSLLL